MAKIWTTLPKDGLKKSGALHDFSAFVFGAINADYRYTSFVGSTNSALQVYTVLVEAEMLFKSIVVAAEATTARKHALAVLGRIITNPLHLHFATAILDHQHIIPNTPIPTGYTTLATRSLMYCKSYQSCIIGTIH